MGTPAIYTMGQLKAYITGRLAAINAAPAPATPTTSAAMDAGRVNAYADCLALIDGIEAHEAAKAAPTAVDRIVAGESPASVAASQGRDIVKHTRAPGFTDNGGSNDA